MITMRSGVKRAVAIAADKLLTAVAPLLVRSRGPELLPTRPRVLVVRCDHIGDAVMATGAVAALRASLQPSILDVLVGPWAAPIFEQHHAVDETLVAELPWWLAARGAPLRRRVAALAALPGVVARVRRKKYDIAIDLRGDLRQILMFLALSGARERVSSNRTGGRALLTREWHHDPDLHEVAKSFAIVELLGATGPMDLAPPLIAPLRPELAAALASAAGPNGTIALATRGTEPNRQWPAHHAASLLRSARSSLGLGVVYVGGPEDHKMGEEIASRGAELTNLAGRTSLKEAIAVLRAVRAAVTVDSGPMHLAALAGTHVIALFGPGNPAESGPWTAKSDIVHCGAPCGCIHPACDYVAPGPGRCMQALEPAAVLDRLRALIAA